MTEPNPKGERKSTVNQLSDTGSASPQPTPITLAIYREIRVGMAVIMVMLAAAIVIDGINAGRLQKALSEYFYTSAHSVFIAALLALSTLFFVYKGSNDTEDALLTLAGVCTLIAALVPQVRPEVFSPYGLPQDYKVEAVVLPNVGAVVVALGLGWSLMWWQHRHKQTKQKRSPGGTVSLYFLRLVVVVGLIALVVAVLVPSFRPLFNTSAHAIAGTLMILSFICTVFCAAYVVRQQEESRHRRRYLVFYWVMVIVMLVTLIAVVTLHIARPRLLGELWIFVLESLLILEFATYWVVQTIELWDTPDRMERLRKDARDRLAERPTKRGRDGLKAELVEAMNYPRGQKLLPLL
jgi:hypothetical protein